MALNNNHSFTLSEIKDIDRYNLNEDISNVRVALTQFVTDGEHNNNMSKGRDIIIRNKRIVQFSQSMILSEVRVYRMWCLFFRFMVKLKVNTEIFI